MDISKLKITGGPGCNNLRIWMNGEEIFNVISLEIKAHDPHDTVKAKIEFYADIEVDVEVDLVD